MRSAKWTLLLNVSSVGERLQKRIPKCEFVLDLSEAARCVVGPAAVAS